MSARATRVTVPETLSSPRAKLVYVSLAVGNGATIDELQTDLSMTKLSLFSVLETLRGRGLVEKRRVRGERREETRDEYVVSSCSGASEPL